MASPESLAMSCDTACNEIEQWARRNVAEGLPPLPRAHRDREVLRKLQLEQIADWVTRANNSSNSSDVLIELIIDMLKSGNWTKQELSDLVLGDYDGNTNRNPDNKITANSRR